MSENVRDESRKMASYVMATSNTELTFIHSIRIRLARSVCFALVYILKCASHLLRSKSCQYFQPQIQEEPETVFRRAPNLLGENVLLDIITNHLRQVHRKQVEIHQQHWRAGQVFAN